jgi:hypothetical protein
VDSPEVERSIVLSAALPATLIKLLTAGGETGEKLLRGGLLI